MRVLSLFDGISGTQQALKNMGITPSIYYASEIDKYAIQVTMKNFPNTIQLGDVTKLHDFDFGEIDLMTWGSPCFVAGSLVYTNNGYKPIEDIKIKDMVLTHNNVFKEVLRVGGKPNQNIYKLSAQGILDIYATKDHPFYICTKIKKWNNRLRRYDINLSEPSKKHLMDIKKDDFIGIHIIKDNINHYNLDKETCWLIGRYIADGHLVDYKRKDRSNSYNKEVIISVGKDKKGTRRFV